MPLFVTVGSPLAIRAIQKTLAPLTFPSPLAEWYNAFDRKDVVALNPLDNTNFAVRRPVENYAAVNNFTENHHGIDGYLRDRMVAKRVLSSLA